MLNNNPTIYVCSDENCVERSHKVMSYLNDKIKSHLAVNMSIDNKEFSITVPLLCAVVAEYDNNLGIIISGMSIYSVMMANRNKEIRAAMCQAKEGVEWAVENYHMNVLCIPTFSPPRLSDNEYIEIIDTYVNTKRKEDYLARNYLLERL